MRSVSISRYPVAGVLSHVQIALDGGPSKVVLDGDVVNVASLRLYTFLVKGTRCASCGITGTHFRKEKGHSSDIRPHLNLYAVMHGSEILMTKDHIVPKAKGGADVLPNMQTMCAPCNESKGDMRSKINRATGEAA